MAIYLKEDKWNLLETKYLKVGWAQPQTEKIPVGYHNPKLNSSMNSNYTSCYLLQRVRLWTKSYDESSSVAQLVAKR